MLLYLRFPVSILSFPFCTFHLTWDVVILFWEFRPWAHRKGRWTDFWKLMVPWIFRADSGCLREPWLLTLVAVVMFLPCSVHWSSWIISLYKTAVLQGQQLFCIMSIYIAIIEFKRPLWFHFFKANPIPLCSFCGQWTFIFIRVWSDKNKLNEIMLYSSDFMLCELWKGECNFFST